MVNTIRDLLFGEPAKPEAPANAEFGRYLFATSRKDTPRPKEQNTDSEDSFEVALKSWFEFNNENPLVRLLPSIVDVMQKNQYQPLLNPGGIQVYRGMKILEQQFKKEFPGVEIPANQWTEFSTEHLLKPYRERRLQSWSSSEKVAGDFLGLKTDNALTWYSILFVARTDAPGNFFFGKPGKLAGAASPSYVKEQEVISVGPVNCIKFKVLLSPGKAARLNE